MQKLVTWEKDNEAFVATMASEHVLNCLTSNSCVTVTGGSGVGKTATVRHVALRMKQEKGYDIVPIASPKDIRDFFTRGKPTVFIVDDLCGNYTANQQQIEHWKQFMDDIKNVLEDSVCKLMVSCRLQVFRDDKLTSLAIFKSCECNLSSEELSLTTFEKQSMAKETFLGSENEDIEQLSKYTFFPLLCNLFRGRISIDIKKYIDNPFLIYKDELDLMFHSGDDGKHKYCALALVVMFNNNLKEASLTGKTNNITKTTIEETCEACHLNKGISKLKLKAELDTLEGTYVIKEDGIYHTIHDKLFDFMAYYFGHRMIPCFIDNADHVLIGERFLWESYELEANPYDNINEENSEQEIDNLTERENIFSISFPDDMLQMYIERMIKDLRQGKVADVIDNRNMNSDSFRGHFLHHINLLDESIQEELARVRDYITQGTVLYHVCCYGGEELVRWLCQHGTDVRICNYYGRSPLHAASEYGYLNIVNLILQEKAKIIKTEKRARLFSCIGSCFGQSQRGNDLLKNTDIVNCCDSIGRTPLWEACLSRHSSIVDKLLECKADVNKSDVDGFSPLYVACQEGLLQAVCSLLDHKADVNMCNKSGTSPLFMACEKGYLQIICRLLESKADANKTDKHGFSPLYVACQHNHLMVVSTLLAYNADINLCNNEGTSPLSKACAVGHLRIVSKLLENNVDIHQVDHGGYSSLYIACQEGHLDVAVTLLDNKASVNQCNKNGISPLSRACEKGHVHIVSKLLDYKANVNDVDNDGFSPLYVACQEGHLPVVCKLLESNINTDQCNNAGTSALFMACQNGYLSIVSKLLEYKADVNKSDHGGFSPLYVSCQQGFIDIVCKLLDYNADVNKVNQIGVSPLSRACEMGQLKIVSMLLAKNAEVNQSDHDGFSPLYMSCQEGHLDIVQKLLENTADINMCNTFGISPLSRACEKGHLTIVNVLLKNKADINKSDQDGFSPLYVTCMEGHLPIVCTLLENHADANLCNNEGSSPLYTACRNGYLDIVSKLLDFKLEVNKCDNDDRSPLYAACQEGYAEIVEVLLENNADINLCSFDGDSPLLISCTAGHSHIVEMLLKEGADVTKCLQNETQKLIKSGWLDFITERANNKLKLYLLGISQCKFYDVIGGFSPLHMTCLMGHIKIIELFLAQNPEVNICKEDGTTPLYVACEVGQTEVVRLLLENKADPHIYRKDGKSPFIVAESNEHFDIMSILQQYITL